MAGLNLIVPVYNDTTEANANIGIDSCGAIFFGREYNGLWYRACSPKRWLQVFPGGGASSDTIAWRFGGNDVTTLVGPPYLGTKQFKEIIFITNNQERMVLPPGGIVRDTNSHTFPLMFDTLTKRLSYGYSYITRDELADTANNIRVDIGQALIDTAAAIREDIPQAPNEIIFGCQVIQITPTIYTISAAQYRLSGQIYNTTDTSITIAVAGDSARIDVFYVDTSSRAAVRTGTMSSNPSPPALNVGTELACSFVFVSQDSVSSPTVLPNYWRYRDWETDRKSTRLNSSHLKLSRMPSSA